MTENADVAGLLAGWLPRQRWFAAAPAGVSLTPAGRIDLPGPAGTDVVVHLVTEVGTAATYQVPLTYRSAPVPDLAPALLGELRTALGVRWVYDGAHDPAFVAAWIGLVADHGDVLAEGSPQTGPRSRVRGVLAPGAPPPVPDRPSRVLSGEQSNTSVIVDGSGPDPLMVKIIRVLQPGRNPDVVVPAALATAGCERVPRLVGWVEGEWVGPGGEPAWGHLSAVAEFIAGSHDGWKLACAAVEDGADWAPMASDLGATTASVHAALARALPTRPTTPDTLAALATHLRDRLAWAVQAAPELAEYRLPAEAVIGAVAELRTAADLQIVHGDLHLGQALHSDARGWVLLDFEGEPLRPLAERGEPDLALRDVAGMLRSFDYAARHTTLGVPGDDPRAVAAATWAARCREAFLDGYAAGSGSDPRRESVLLRALELDKALYETVYEHRHRPTWVEVPLHAVGRLLGAGATHR